GDRGRVARRASTGAGGTLVEQLAVDLERDGLVGARVLRLDRDRRGARAWRRVRPGETGRPEDEEQQRAPHGHRTLTYAGSAPPGKRTAILEPPRQARGHLADAGLVQVRRETRRGPAERCLPRIDVSRILPRAHAA